MLARCIRKDRDEGEFETITISERVRGSTLRARAREDLSRNSLLGGFAWQKVCLTEEHRK